MSAAEALDHVGIAGHDLTALAEKWQRLGFQLTPFARHSGRRTPDGPGAPFGTGNRCILLRHGYLERIVIVDPEAFSDKLATFLALSIADEQANLARLRRAGIDIPGIADLERPIVSTRRPAGGAGPGGQLFPRTFTWASANGAAGWLGNNLPRRGDAAGGVTARHRRAMNIA